MAGFGFFISWFFVGGSTTRQKHTPSELMGRVYGGMSLVMQASQAAGNALGALLVLLMSYQYLAYLSAGALALAALYLTASQPQRKSWRSVIHRLPRAVRRDVACGDDPLVVFAAQAAESGRDRVAEQPAD